MFTRFSIRAELQFSSFITFKQAKVSYLHGISWAVAVMATVVETQTQTQTPETEIETLPPIPSYSQEASGSYELTWTKAQLSQEGERIPARGGHTCVVADYKVIVFGGHYYSGGKTFVYLNDVWVLDVETFAWQQVRCGGTPPDPRYGHTCELVGSRMFIVGGRGKDGQLYRDVAFLDLVEWVWSPVNATSSGPSPRFGHASTLVGRKIVIHGGWDGAYKCYDDLWVFDTDSFSWLQPRTAGIAPSGRYGHTIQLLSDGRVIVFGGAVVEKDGKVPQYLNDLRQLDTETMQWSKPWTKGMVPSGRYGHSLTLAEDGTALFYGGWGLGGLQGAGNVRKGAEPVFLYNPRVADIEVPVLLTRGGPENMIPSLHGHSCAAVGDAFFVFGGWDAQQACSEVLVMELKRVA